MRLTLNAIRAHGPCEDGWRLLLERLGKSKADDEPLSLLTVLDSNGLDDALWCLRAMPEHDKEWRLFAIWCARKAQFLLTDPDSLAALNVAEAYARGTATLSDLVKAHDSAFMAAAGAKGSAELAAMDAAAAAAESDACYAAMRAAMVCPIKAASDHLREVWAEIEAGGNL